LSQVLSPTPRLSASGARPLAPADGSASRATVEPPTQRTIGKRLRGALGRAGRLVADALGSAATTLLGPGKLLGGRAAAPEPSPIERVLLHREQLLSCAMQLLDDETAAQQVTLEAIQQALRSPMLVPLASGAPDAADGPSAGAASSASLGRWLERLVINLSLQRIKALSTLGLGMSKSGSSETWPVVPREPAAETPSRPEESTQLSRASQVLSQLPAETRVAVMLVVMQGRSVAEASELLGCSEVTCRFWLSHGRKLLRRALQRDLIEDDLMSRESRVLVSPGALHDLRRNKKAAARA
jgi:DNA-directed RNA polymerase specialized sigma24 family protein